MKVYVESHTGVHAVLSSALSANNFSLDASVPTDPSPLSSPSKTSSSVNLSWTASSDAGCKGLTGYKVWRDGVEIATGLTGTTYTDSGRAEATTYSYVVKAYDDFHSTDSNTISVTTDDVTAPTIPGPPSPTTPSSDNTPIWNWTASTDNVGVAKYQVCWAQTQNCTSVMAEPTSNSYTHTTALSDGTWYFRAKAVDAANNASGYSGNGSVVIDTTPPPPPPAPGDTTPPSISLVSANNIGETTVTISWTTNESATSQVEYGLTVSYGKLSNEDTTLKTNHAPSLGSLTAGATYHYRVKSRDAAGNLATSGDFTFKTQSPPDKQVPIVSNVTSNSYAAETRTINISWTTNESATSQIEYGETESLGQTTVEDGRLVTNHTVQLTGIAKELVYYFKVRSKDAAGNLGISALFIFDTKSGEPERDVSLAAPTLEKLLFNNQEMAVDTAVLKVTKEDTFILVGKTFPFAKVKLYANSSPRIYETSTNGEGSWMVTIAAVDFERGEHKVESEAETRENKLTRREEILRFEVIAAEEEKAPEPKEEFPAVALLLIPAVIAAIVFGALKLKKRFFPPKGPPPAVPSAVPSGVEGLPPQLPPVV